MLNFIIKYDTNNKTCKNSLKKYVDGNLKFLIFFVKKIIGVPTLLCAHPYYIKLSL